MRFLLKPAVFLGGIAALLSGCGPKAAKQIELPVAGPLRLDGVTIVDTENGALSPGMSIWMDRGRIVRITTTSATPTDPSERSVDAAGKFVVPGYNNMHSHALAAGNASGVMALMLTEGVTGFRQMSGSPELLKARREGTLPIGKDAPGLLAMPGNLLLAFNTVSIEDTGVEIRLLSSARSRSRSARSVSACELTDTYSPAAIDMAPATRLATPAIMTLL